MHTLESDLDRFMEKVEITDECWAWMAFIEPTGYARFWADGRQWSAHRWIYEAVVGEVPPGLVVDHLCNNRACVNPDHLEAKTQRENVLRAPGTIAARNLAKSSCPQGHPYDEANTYVVPGRRSRRCRTCRREQTNRSSRRRRARLGQGGHPL